MRLPRWVLEPGNCLRRTDVQAVDSRARGREISTRDSYPDASNTRPVRASLDIEGETVSRFVCALMIGVVGVATASGQDAKPDTRMNPMLLWKLGRLGGGVVSADGKHVALSLIHI